MTVNVIQPIVIPQDFQPPEEGGDLPISEPNHIAVLGWLQYVANLGVSDVLLRLENCKDLIMRMQIEGTREERVEKVRPICQQIAALVSGDKLRHSPLGIGAGNRDAGEAVVILLALSDHFTQIMVPIDDAYLEAYPDEGEE